MENKIKQLVDDILPLIEQFAPTIAGALATHMTGFVPSFALSLLASKFSKGAVSPHTLPDDIRNDPQSNDKLAQLEEVFAEWFKNNSGVLTMPAHAEVDVKLDWEKK